MRRPQCLIAAFFILSGVGGTLSGLLGCSGDTLNGPPPLSPAQAYWALTLNVHAVNLDLTKDRTVQLSAVPFNALGDTLHGLGVVTYTAAADSTVSVSPTGLVTAKLPTAQTSVIASLTVQGVTLADTVMLQVTPTPLATALTTFSLQPVAGDSAIRSVDTQGYQVPLTATDAAGTTVCAPANSVGCPLLVYYTTSNPPVATIDRASGEVTPVVPGQVTFYAMTMMGGRVYTDSVHFHVGYLLIDNLIIKEFFPVNQLQPDFIFQQQTIIVGVGGVVQIHGQPDQLMPYSNLAIKVNVADTTRVSSVCFNDNCEIYPAKPRFPSGTNSWSYFTDPGPSNYSRNGLFLNFEAAGVYKVTSDQLGQLNGTVYVQGAP